MESAYSEVLRAAPGSPFTPGTTVPLNRLENSFWDMVLALPSMASRKSLSSLAGHLRELTGAKHILFAPSCRAAIAKILSALPQQEVVVPAYTCPVVKTAIQVAGKRLVYADAAAGSINASVQEFGRCAKPRRVLMPTHLFGIPTDIQEICRLARESGCVTIEDAAGALGARLDGRWLGTFADIGIFSFQRSKRFPAFQGAAIIINNEEAIDHQKLAGTRVAQSHDSAPVREFLFALMFKAATEPWIYGRFIVPRQLRRYQTWTAAQEPAQIRDVICSAYYTREFHPYQAALVLRMLSRIELVRKQIGRLVAEYQQVLKGTQVMTFFRPGMDDSGLLRFPVAVPGATRAEILRQALRHGLLLETNYERILAGSADGDFPNAQWLGSNIFLLPLYSALSVSEARRISSRVAEIASACAKPIPA